jgi:hypothetical protein
VVIRLVSLGSVLFIAWPTFLQVSHDPTPFGLWKWCLASQGVSPALLLLSQTAACHGRVHVLPALPVRKGTFEHRLSAGRSVCHTDIVAPL